MFIFYVEIVLVYIFAVYARLISNKNRIARNIFLFLVIATLVLVSGLRSNIGDTGAYTYLYKLIGPTYESEGGYEIGFVMFLKVLKSITDNPQFMIFIFSLITNCLIAITFFRYPGYNELVLYMYITSGYYLVTMNGIRQCLVAAILFACTMFIVKGRFIYYLAAVLLMITIHTSAIIMIPIYFIVRTEAWSKKMFWIIVVFFIGLVLYGPVMNVVFSYLGDSKYAGYKDFNEGGANPIRIAIAAVPVVLGYVKRHKLKEAWPQCNVFVNMALINAIIMCFSLYNWIFARFTIYTELYGLVLLGSIFKICCDRRERNFFYAASMSAYLIYFLYEQVITLGIQYKSDYLFKFLL